MMLKIQNIAKKYKKQEVLKDITFTVPASSFIGILGSNGCGKSTLLSVLAGILRADSGKFLLDETDLLRDSALRAKKVGYVPQGTPLMQELTAHDNLLLWYTREELACSLRDGVLSHLDIGTFLHVPVCKMSGGMKKRLSIACAMAQKPSVLLLDEPTSALDLSCKAKIYRYLRQYTAQGGTVLLTTHDISELSLCDKLYILKNGTLLPYVYDKNLPALLESLQP